MHRFITVVMLFAGVVSCSRSCPAGGPPDTDPAATKKDLLTVDLLVLSTNCIVIGTNTFSVTAAREYVAARREALDVVAVHEWSPGKGATVSDPSVLTKIASAGVPLVVVEKDGELAWREDAGPDGIRTLKLGTGQFAYIRQLLTQGKIQPAKPSTTTLQTTLQWDTVEGDYSLSQVELGFFGKRVWIVHEQHGGDEDAATIGIQLKREW